MKPGNVIYYNPNHPSFNWDKGLFVILEIKGTTLYMCKISNNKEALELFNNGRCITTCIEISGPIELTKLVVDITNLTW